MYVLRVTAKFILLLFVVVTQPGHVYMIDTRNCRNHKDKNTTHKKCPGISYAHRDPCKQATLKDLVKTRSTYWYPGLTPDLLEQKRPH